MGFSSALYVCVCPGLQCLCTAVVTSVNFQWVFLIWGSLFDLQSICNLSPRFQQQVITLTLGHCLIPSSKYCLLQDEVEEDVLHGVKHSSCGDFCICVLQGMWRIIIHMCSAVCVDTGDCINVKSTTSRSTQMVHSWQKDECETLDKLFLMLSGRHLGRWWRTMKLFSKWPRKLQLLWYLQWWIISTATVVGQRPCGYLWRSTNAS